MTNRKRCAVYVDKDVWELFGKTCAPLSRSQAIEVVMIMMNDTVIQGLENAIFKAMGNVLGESMQKKLIS